MMVVSRKISVIVAAHNDEACIDELTYRLTLVFDDMPTIVWESVIIDNGSDDGTFARIEGVVERDARFSTIQLARHFRNDGAFTAGLAVSDADAVVLLHADLSDPPEMIPELVDRWEAGYENVFAVDDPDRRRGRFVASLSDKLTGGLVPSGAGDYRLLDRRVYEQVRDMEERNRFVQGLVAWVGFRSTGVQRSDRSDVPAADRSSDTGRAERSIKAVFAHSQVPLVLIPAVGIGLALLSFLALVALTINWLTRGVPFPGFGTIVALMVMLFGILFCMLGVVSVYIGLIYEEAKGRPNFVIRRTVGLGARGVGEVVPPITSSNSGVRSDVPPSGPGDSEAAEDRRADTDRSSVESGNRPAEATRTPSSGL
jgi:dolichol-phosphate mannosyltransferase